jgi:EAL domain-containing protein (putative c-di-GMP-specific phosphodiesterase class I)
MQVNSYHHIIGAEALIRWEHPERGQVLPDDFIPIAEEIGLILPIGHWVLKSACEQIRIWSGSADTRELRLSVNVSARQFHQAEFVEQVRLVLAETGANPARLVVELTESSILEDVGDTVAKMRALKKLGIRLAMDDFGTGYSSLSYLKQLPLDELKIDQSFVRDLSVDANDAAVVQAIITLGRTFELTVIAEGVETDAQFEFLELYGCHVFQGYMFSKPVPLQRFEVLVRQQ